jgi:hypothetical protein
MRTSPTGGWRTPRERRKKRADPLLFSIKKTASCASPRDAVFFGTRSIELLNDLDVFGLGAFGRIFDFEADFLAFGQGLEAVTLDRSVMDEKVLSILLLDEAVALFLVEPLH